MPPVSPKDTMFWLDEVRANKIKFTWKIGGVTDKSSWLGCASPEFTGDDDRFAWALVMYPNRGILELQLRNNCEKPCANKVYGSCKLSALNAKNKEVKVLKRNFKALSSEKKVLTFKNFLKRDLSVKGVRGSLKEHHMTILCEITTFTEQEIQARNSSCIVI